MTEWMILTQEVVDTISTIKDILDRKRFPLCVEIGILEDLKHRLMHEGHKDLRLEK